MAVKKIYAGYESRQSDGLRNLPDLQRDLAELKSHTEDYYIAQYEKRQAVERERRIREMKENLRKYSEKYYEIMQSHPFSPETAASLIFTNLVLYNVQPSQGKTAVHLEKNPIKQLALLDPKNMKIPDEPIPLMDLVPPKAKDQSRIQMLEHEIWKHEQLKIEMSASQVKPLQLDNHLWLYQDCVYEVTGKHSFDEMCLLIMESADKDRRKFERLKNKFSENKSEELKYERVHIPEEVRIAVWRRDQGRCARCGSRENLEYDHIVPVSKGGGNTERNIELLCQDCNRAKGNRIE